MNCLLKAGLISLMVGSFEIVGNFVIFYFRLSPIYFVIKEEVDVCCLAIVGILRRLF